MTKLETPTVIVILLQLFLCPAWANGGFTFFVFPGKQECFYEPVKHDYTILINYAVIAASHAQGHDINFQVSDQAGRPVLTEFRKRQSERSIEVRDTGLFRFCFDNTFSHLSRKLVTFTLSTEDGKKEAQWGGQIDQAAFQPEEIYELTVKEIEASINRVRVQMSTVQSSQSTHRNLETRDRSTAESNYSRINFWSAINLVLMIIVGVCQVLMLKGLFDEKYNVKKVFKENVGNKLY